MAQAIEQIGEVSVQLMRIEGTMKKRLDEIEDKVDDLNEEMSSLKERVTKLMEEVVTEEEVPGRNSYTMIPKKLNIAPWPKL